MGGREVLLAAAKRSLVERGWGATTVRDVAATAGVSHAAIGYHFGSRDALMTEALIDAVADLGREVATTDAVPGSDEHWQALLDTFRTHRALWLAQLEAVRHAERSPEIRRILMAGQRQAQEALGGPVPQALLLGLAVQALVDPEIEIRAEDLPEVLRRADVG